MGKIHRDVSAAVRDVREITTTGKSLPLGDLKHPSHLTVPTRARVQWLTERTLTACQRLSSLSFPYSSFSWSMSTVWFSRCQRTNIMPSFLSPFPWYQQFHPCYGYIFITGGLAKEGTPST